MSAENVRRARELADEWQREGWSFDEQEEAGPLLADLCAEVERLQAELRLKDSVQNGVLFCVDNVVTELHAENERLRAALAAQATEDAEALQSLREAIDEHLPHYEPEHEAGDYEDVVRIAGQELPHRR